ncbi:MULTISPECIES: DUF2798 domain-containing protein [Pseudoalteromonas]|jgi:hypothetical protein|uniref:DUF2798 domain-containing protein n=1 Tax=Pseudoalteromonas lipolytica TaxID=570156 RepID=A0AAD0S3V6_9GAMM|nr:MULTISPECIES: DUF2798 domain-containing protein [Pseudoalteromonas]AXV67347.1 DUF2798 domain-containing protein [Pseudoalteromonas donghaensis]QLJ10251.1 DUF2798 domain-containing protein [Pseudoalteromonas sp. JSTW]QMW16726.1 DUF2798 domain-containing protein [Pseudoalteromonas sp. MT33b]|tara:strand:- start:7412 stop:7633 length:222 start_codon:yes stop_codon:yes gene_type:complete
MKIHFIFTAAFSFLMSFLLSAWVTYVNLGLSDTFIASWMKAFANAWPAAFVVAFTVAPPIRTWVLKLFSKESV